MAYKNKEDATAYQKVYREKNKEKISARQKDYREKNKGKIKDYREEHKEERATWLSTEKGFLSNLYSGCKRRTKKKQAKYPSKEWSLLSKEEFLNLWEEHKAKHGYNCGYYNDEPIIMQRSAPNKNGKRNPTPKNLLSVDCLNPEKGYTKENIVFCGWAVNDRKNSIRKKDCHLIIRKYEERNQ